MTFRLYPAQASLLGLVDVSPSSVTTDVPTALDLQKRMAFDMVLAHGRARNPVAPAAAPTITEDAGPSWWDRLPGESRQVWRRRTGQKVRR